MIAKGVRIREKGKNRTVEEGCLAPVLSIRKHIQQGTKTKSLKLSPLFVKLLRCSLLVQVAFCCIWCGGSPGLAPQACPCSSHNPWAGLNSIILSKCHLPLWVTSKIFFKKNYYLQIKGERMRRHFCQTCQMQIEVFVYVYPLISSEMRYLLILSPKLRERRDVAKSRYSGR